MSTVRPGELGEGKIQGWHRDRLAIVYLLTEQRDVTAAQKAEPPWR